MTKVDMTAFFKFSVIIVFACWTICSCAPAQEPPSTAAAEERRQEWRVASPDGALVFTVAETSAGRLQYRVDLDDGIAVIDWSDLGVEVSRGVSFDGPEPVIANFAETVSVLSDEAGDLSQSYEMKTGKRRMNASQANTLSLMIADQETQQRLALDIRVQNDGFGFRYRLPGDDPMFSVVNAEATAFALDPNGRFWGQPYDFAGQWTPAYETRFENGIPIGSDVGEKGTGWGFPSLFETAGGAWLLLHEAGLSKSFHGSHLEPEAPGGVYKIAFPLADSAWGYGKASSSAPGPWVMPWRIGIVGRGVGDILESNLVFDFADQSRIEDPSWIRPGVSSWSWLSDHASSRDIDKLKDFIDLATEMGWPYSLVDANWNTISPNAMQDLAAYADAQGVGLFFWYNSGGRHNTVPEAPRNIMSDPKLRKAEFAKLQRLGVKGVKIDFFQSDKQDIIALYLDILEDAAAFNILVNFHGSTIPRGWERTWPNLVSMEAVLGGEVYTFPSDHNYGEIAPHHNTILPFTRNVIGSMDYTPVIYSEQLIPRLTTNGHETALAVVFESGVQHIADAAASLRELPDTYKAFFKNLPTVWDETRYLSGRPGDYVVIARRHDDRWYVAGINGSPDKKSVILDLSFTGAALEGTVLLHDDETGSGFGSSTFRVSELESVQLEMNAYGGFVLAR